jgi:hypothetical protein
VKSRHVGNRPLERGYLRGKKCRARLAELGAAHAQVAGRGSPELLSEAPYGGITFGTHGSDDGRGLADDFIATAFSGARERRASRVQ